MSTKLLATLLLLFASGALPLPARATQTDPVLLVSGARALEAPDGTLIEIDATFPQADLVQRPLALQVLVRDLADGRAHVRFALDSGPVSGSLAALADGLDAEDVPLLLTIGTPFAGARLLRLAPGRIELWLPPAAGFAAAEVQLFLVYEGDPILSNPAPLEVLDP